MFLPFIRRTALVVLGLLALPAAAQQSAQPLPLTAEALSAAERLFEIPAYRQLATRQLYRALESLPEAQYHASVDALNDPQVVQILRGVIARSMAQTFTLQELDFMARILATDEARAIVAKSDLLQSLLTRELAVAALSNPDLARILSAP